MTRHPNASFVPRFTAGYAVSPAIFLAVFIGACGGPDLPEPDSETYRETVSAFYTGLAAIESGIERQGEENLLRVTELAPGEPAAWVNLGLLAMRRNEYALASEYLGEAQTLAPENSVIRLLLGLFEKSQGNVTETTAHLQEAVALDSTNVKALYALAEHLTGAGGDEATALLDAILKVHPDNLAALLRRAGAAAASGDTDAIRHALGHIETLSASWPDEALEQLAGATGAVSGPGAPDFAAATTHIAFLRNVLLRVSSYRQDLRAIQTPAEQVGDLMTGLLRLPAPPPAIAPRDDQLTFTQQELEAEGGPWRSMAIFSAAAGADGNGGDNGTNVPGVALAIANDRAVQLLNGQLLDFPGGGAAPGLYGIAGIDYDYDFTMDLALAGTGGLRIFRQDSTGSFTETTRQLGLPAAILDASLAGVWAADLDLEGDVDLVLARNEGASLALRNNGDGTFAPLDLFGDVEALRSFAWGDFDGDGDPDAALVDANGTLHLFANRRSGLFERQSAETEHILALEAADLNGDATVDLAALQADGTILRLSTTGEDAAATWSSEEIAHWEDMPVGIAPGTGQLFAVDLDNNGGLDLVAATPAGARVWLRDADETNGGHRGGTLYPTDHAIASHLFAVADLSANGRLDLLGFSEAGQPVLLENEGSKPYHWKQMYLRAAEAVGDQRINSFGIGGEVEIRAGLSFQKQVIKGPVVHFGLGTHAVADVARIVWPNGSVQAEFDLLSGEVVLAQQRLKGSCPWLFAWNGEHIDFVTDFIWRSPLGLKINAQETAGVMTTEDWVKIRGDQLAPRPGKDGAPPWYDVRITAELWETHFFDHVSLLVVDHPDDTEVYVDERFAFPPPEMKVHVTAKPHPVTQAWDDLGNDVTDLVHTQDGRYLATFGHGQYQGVTRDHYVELALENIPEDTPQDGPVWLVASGWIYPTDSSINVALGQGSHAPPQGLRLEASDGKGGWRTVHPNLGFPAGKAKTVLMDITEVLAGRHEAGAPEGSDSIRLRLHTNLEIYWDAFAWTVGRPDAETTTRRLTPDAADLRYRGFSETYEADAFSPELPVYDELAGTSQVWRDLVGYHTRFGDVRELLAEVDDRYVIMNAADEMAFRFEAPPLPPEGWTRDFVLIGDGWVKDGDYNTGFSKTVLPLPSHDDPAYATPPGRLEDDPVYRRFPDDWARYHTRYVTPERFQGAMRVE